MGGSGTGGYVLRRSIDLIAEIGELWEIRDRLVEERASGAWDDTKRRELVRVQNSLDDRRRRLDRVILVERKQSTVLGARPVLTRRGAPCGKCGGPTLWDAREEELVCARFCGWRGYLSA